MTKYDQNIIMDRKVNILPGFRDEALHFLYTSILIL